MESTSYRWRRSPPALQHRLRRHRRCRRHAHHIRLQSCALSPAQASTTRPPSRPAPIRLQRAPPASRRLQLCSSLLAFHRLTQQHSEPASQATLEPSCPPASTRHRWRRSPAALQHRLRRRRRTRRHARRSHRLSCALSPAPASTTHPPSRRVPALPRHAPPASRRLQLCSSLLAFHRLTQQHSEPASQATLEPSCPPASTRHRWRRSPAALQHRLRRRRRTRRHARRSHRLSCALSPAPASTTHPPSRRVPALPRHAPPASRRLQLCSSLLAFHRPTQPHSEPASQATLEPSCPPA